jgi:peptidoglycan pentaglycine glycine transferase (the first glycine)
MDIRKNKNKKDWEDFLLSEKSVFLQSSLWGDFKEKYQKVERFESVKNDKINGVCQVFEERSPFGKYLYVPFGPVSKSEETRENLINYLLDKTKKEGYLFLRIEPLYEIKSGVKQFSRVQPQKTLISRIDKPVDDLLKELHATTRYNVRYAKKRGVLIVDGNVDDFYNLLLKTKKRQRFSSYQKEYFENLLKIKGSKIISAVYDKKVIAATILFYFNKTVTFLHSASDYEMRHLKATALLRFDSVEHAKEDGCVYYDFWGIDEKRFPGVTQYKKGFGGEELLYPDGKDFPIKKLRYFLYKNASRLK